MRINVIGFQKQHFDVENQIRWAKGGKGQLNGNGALQIFLEKACHKVGYGLKNADLNIICLSNLHSIIIGRKYVEMFDKWVNENNITKENTTFLIEDWNIKAIQNSNKKMLEDKGWKTNPALKGYQLSDKTLEILSWYFDGHPTWVCVHQKTTKDYSNLGLIGRPLFFDPTPLLEYSSNSEIKELKPVYTSLVVDKSYLKKNDLNEENSVIINKATEQECLDAIHSYRICMMPVHYHLKDQKGKAYWYRNRYTQCYQLNAILVSQCGILEYNLDWKTINKNNFDTILKRQKLAYEKIFKVSIEDQVSLVKENLKSLEM